MNESHNSLDEWNDRQNAAEIRRRMLEEPTRTSLPGELQAGENAYERRADDESVGVLARFACYVRDVRTEERVLTVEGQTAEDAIAFADALAAAWNARHAEPRCPVCRELAFASETDELHRHPDCIGGDR